MRIRVVTVSPVNHQLHHCHRTADNTGFPASMGMRTVSSALREVLKATRRYDEGVIGHASWRGAENLESAVCSTDAAFTPSLTTTMVHDLAIRAICSAYDLMYQSTRLER